MSPVRRKVNSWAFGGSSNLSSVSGVMVTVGISSSMTHVDAVRDPWRRAYWPSRISACTWLLPSLRISSVVCCLCTSVRSPAGNRRSSVLVLTFSATNSALGALLPLAYTNLSGFHTASHSRTHTVRLSASPNSDRIRVNTTSSPSVTTLFSALMDTSG